MSAEAFIGDEQPGPCDSCPPADGRVPTPRGCVRPTAAHPFGRVSRLGASPGSPLRRRPRVGEFVRLFVVLAIVSLLIASVLLPVGWCGDEKRHPALDDVPRITLTKRGLPGDPLNVAFVGSLEELHLAMLAAGWFPADPITLKSSLRIAAGN